MMNGQVSGESGEVGVSQQLLGKANQAFEDCLRYILESSSSSESVFNVEKESNFARVFSLSCKDLEDHLQSVKAPEKPKVLTKNSVQKDIEKLEQELAEKNLLLEKYKMKLEEWSQELKY